MSNPSPHISHGDPNLAYHIEWNFRNETLIWIGKEPFGVNLHPLATEIRAWLLRKAGFSVFEEKHRDEILSIKNPYTYHASVIAAISLKPSTQRTPSAAVLNP